MNANELRLANLLNYKSKPVVITGLSLTTVDFLEGEVFKSTSVASDDLSGISLTDNWLLMFGFEKKENYGASDEWYWNLRLFMLNIESDGVLVPGSSSHDYDCLSIDCAKPVIYVHQLQNLYFALTGEDLTFKS